MYTGSMGGKSRGQGRARAWQGRAGRGRAGLDWAAQVLRYLVDSVRKEEMMKDKGGTRLEVEMGSYTVESPGGEKGEG